VNVVIANNSADGDGGGIYCYHNSNQSLVNVVLANNSANVDGGGICCYDSSPSLQNVTISGNSASSTGGGITCKTTSYPRLENIPISGNSASQYGGCGITCRNVSNPSLFNVTISGNTAGSGGGIYCAESSLSLINSILWNNLPPEIGTYSSSVTATYSDIEGGWEGEGNIDEDPLFVNPIEGDFHLTEDSPCIDAGDPFCPPDPDGTRADMGAYYFHHIGEEEVYADFYADTTIAYMPLPVNFYDLSVAFNTEITTWLWDFDNDGTIDSYEQNPSYIYQNPGYYSVSLTVEDDIGNSNTMIKTDYIAVYPPAYSGNIFHISPEGSNDIGNGSPEYPFATIQHGIFVAENGDTVMVHQGTYPENINYNGKNIIIGSLFLTTQDTTYISQTIIDGSQDGSVVTFESGEDSTAVLIGFIITNGSAVQGGGIYCYNSSPRLENVTIIGNTAADNGGGIYCNDNSNPKLMNVTIIGNSSYYGGGIYCYNSDPCLIDVMIIGNTATIFGGGIYCWQSSPCLENVTISCNSANHGGGISCSNNSSPSLVNVVIANNSAVNVGGGIYCHDSSPILENVTITDNSALYYGGGGIWCYNNSNPTLVNCILWNDTPEEIYYLTSTVTATYSMEMVMELLSLIWEPTNTEHHHMLMYTIVNCQLSIVNCQFYNYPNPFNPFTIIKFTTENTEKNTELVIYNLKGQKVKTLVNEQLQQGGHSIIWNGRDSNGKRVGSGIYFYKLKTGDFQKVKKMILLR
jgi:predicted outer membrane repeat protein